MAPVISRLSTTLGLPGIVPRYTPVTAPALALLFPLPVGVPPGDPVPDRFDDDLAMLQAGLAGLQLQVQFLDMGGNPINISPAVSMRVLLRTPDLAPTSYNFPAALLTNGTDGAIQYVTQAGDLISEGIWFIQGEVTLPNNVILLTRVGLFKVLRNVNG